METVVGEFSARFFERYTFVKRIDVGTHGATYVMQHQRLERKVLVRALRSDASTPELVARVLREASILSSLTLTSARLVRIFETAVDGNTPYMVSEFVEGSTLRTKLRRTRSPSIPRALRIGLKILRGLKEVHEKSIVHGSLDPSSICFVRDGGLKIGDFCLPRSYFHAPVARKPGTPEDYRSPEMMQGEPPSVAGDLYAAALIVLELVVGRHPLLEAATRAPAPGRPVQRLPAARTLNAQCPVALEKVLARALHPDPKKRYRSAGTLRHFLRKVSRVLSGAAEVPKVSKPAVKPSWKVPVGTKLNGRYELVRFVNEVDTGQIWLARDLAMDGDEVSVRLLPPDVARDPEALANVRQEALVAQKLAHPNIVRLILFEPGPPPFLLMEHASGATLAEAIQDRVTRAQAPFTLAETGRILDALASALQYAHDSGVFHRDVRPRNIVLTPGPGGVHVPKLLDFGLAAEVTSFRTGVSSKVRPDVLEYMSPEQQACQRLDGRSDVYSLAATLFHMLTLTLPDLSRSPAPLMNGVSPELARVVHQGLARRPEDRQASPSQLATEFRHALSKPVAISPPASPPRSHDEVPRTQHVGSGHDTPPTRLPPPPGAATTPPTVELSAEQLAEYRRRMEAPAPGPAVNPPNPPPRPHKRKKPGRQPAPRRSWTSVVVVSLVVVGLFFTAALAWRQLHRTSFEDYVIERAGKRLIAKLERLAGRPADPAKDASPQTDESPPTDESPRADASPATGRSVARKVFQVALPAARSVITELTKAPDDTTDGASPTAPASPGGRSATAKRIFREALPAAREMMARIRGKPGAPATPETSPLPESPPTQAPASPAEVETTATAGTAAPPCDVCQRAVQARGSLSREDLARFHAQHLAFTRAGGSPPPGATAAMATALASAPAPAAAPLLSSGPQITEADLAVFREQQRIGMLPAALTERQMLKIRRSLSLALAGRAKSKADLAALFELGVGVPRNLTVSLRWYQEAARMGDLMSVSKVSQFTGPSSSQAPR